MYLSKLTINPYSREFRRDNADIQHMHRTVMSAYPDLPDDQSPRQTHRVLWRLDEARRGPVLLVQSLTKPDWTDLPEDYLTEPAQTRSLQPVLDAVKAGGRYAFRLTTHVTRTIHPDGEPGNSGKAIRVPRRDPADQIAWLARQGERLGFVIPMASNGQPDVVPSPRPPQSGRRPGQKGMLVRIEPLRYDGHLVITNPTTFAEALQDGIGRSRAYGCGLITLARQEPTTTGSPSS